MRKGIKKWHSRNAKINELKNKEIELTKMCDDLYDRQLVLEGFIKDIYSSTKNDTRLCIQEKEFRFFRFLEDARIAHLQMSYEQKPFEIKKPHELAQEYQFERRQKEMRMFDNFSFKGCN
jgi:hypothetical protein